MRPQISCPRATLRPARSGLASCQNLVLWAFFTVFMGPVKRVNTFHSAYLAPQARL
jgi:hypothetical protein